MNANKTFKAWFYEFESSGFTLKGQTTVHNILSKCRLSTPSVSHRTNCSNCSSTGNFASCLHALWNPLLQMRITVKCSIYFRYLVASVIHFHLNVLNRFSVQPASDQAGVQLNKSSTVELSLLNISNTNESYALMSYISWRPLFEFDKMVSGIILRTFNIEEGLDQVFKTLYDYSSSAGVLNNQRGDFFRTSVDVRQGCLLLLCFSTSTWKI